MSKLKIIKDNKEIEIELKNVLTGKDQKRYLKILGRMEKNPELMTEFLELQDEMIAKITGFKKEEVENLLLTEKEKLASEVFKVVSESLGFMKTLSRQQNLLPEEKGKS